ncbi:MAG: Type 1 glutamine amidotransferase-like domain-containing protein [Thermoleophilia bacterium]|nr:Type 1 glutamine amidotransferase-like domain-containing protein [Thermoleophilia bacterium]
MSEETTVVQLRGPQRQQIVTFGGGGFSMESGNPLLDDYVLSLTDGKRPKVCFIPTPSGDADHYIVRFYRAFPASECEPSHLSLFRRERGPTDLRRRRGPTARPAAKPPIVGANAARVAKRASTPRI